MMEFNPNYNEYRKILRDINQTGKYCDYKDAVNHDEFIILRHDIEFSIPRAYELSLIEDSEYIKSTYFVQLTNQSYNAFSKENVELLKKMHLKGHYIGLHYHCHGDLNQKNVMKGILRELSVLETMLEFHIDRFSMHRPAKESKYWEIEIPGIINAYGEDFFCYSDEIVEKPEVKYIADSKHRWNYGEASLSEFMKHKKIQLLIHPFSWTSHGYNNENNFKSLLNEKSKEMMNTFENEFQRYAECKQMIKNEYKEFKVE